MFDEPTDFKTVGASELKLNAIKQLLRFKKTKNQTESINFNTESLGT